MVIYKGLRIRMTEDFNNNSGRWGSKIVFKFLLRVELEIVRYIGF